MKEKPPYHAIREANGSKISTLDDTKQLIR
jgi:hypothetical protein